MSSKRRNEFLEADGSEDDVDGYQSDEPEAGRGGIGGHKRRKTDEDRSDDGSFESFGEGGETGAAAARPTGHTVQHRGQERFQLRSDFDEAEGAHAPGVTDDALASKPGKPTSKSKTPRSVAKADKAARKSGVVYISRVPPFMKPQTLRHVLAPHASKGIGRIFLTPEDHSAHLQRVKRGGNKKKSFTDGWVEFTSKTQAQIAAETLNGNIIGGKKGNFYHDDLWNIKYLKGFKWSHLTEQIANENAERAARLREEVRKTRKENKAFLEDVEKGKMLKGMEEKKKAKQKGAVDAEAERSNPEKAGRVFKQRVVKARDKASSTAAPDGFQRVGSMIF